MKKTLGFAVFCSALSCAITLNFSSNDSMIVNAADNTTVLYESGTPSWGSNYFYGEKQLNSVSWYLTTAGNGSSIGWNKSSQNKTSSAALGPIESIEEKTKYGAYQTSNSFANASKITISITNTDSVTGSFYIWTSVDSGKNWVQVVKGGLDKTTSELAYDAGFSIGNDVRFAFGFGCTKTTGTRIAIKNISIFEQSEEQPEPTGISISGSLAKSDYTNKQEWSAEGLTANVTTSNGSEYAGKINWSFEPSTPAEMGITDNGELKVTASVGDISDIKTFAVSVTPGKGSQELPYSAQELYDAIKDGTVSSSDIEYVEGYKVGTSNSYPVIADSSDTDSKTILLYSAKLDASIEDAYSSITDIPTGSKITAYGNPKKYSSTYETDKTIIISIVEPVLDSLNVELADAKKEFLQHYTVSKDDLKVTANYSNGFKKELASDEFEFVSGQNLNNAGEATIVVKCGEITGSILIDVKANELTGISIGYDVVSNVCYDGDDWSSLVKLKFSLNYSGQGSVAVNEDVVTYNFQDAAGNIKDKPEVGMTSIDVVASYETNGKTFSNEITITNISVLDTQIESITWTNAKTTFAVGENFNLGNSAVNISFNNSKFDKEVTLDDENLSVFLEETKINVETYEFSKGDSGKSIYLSYIYKGTEVKTASITINVVEETIYKKVLDVNSLKSGDIIAIVREDKGTYSLNSNTNGYLDSRDGLSFGDNSFHSNEVETFVLEKSGSSWHIVSASGLVGTTAAKKLTYNSGTTEWNISIDENGDATIASTNSSYGKILYNSGSPRFLNYTSNPNASMLLPQIYKATTNSGDLSAFIELFEEEIKCDPSGVNPLNQNSWDTIGETFGLLNSSDQLSMKYTLSDSNGSDIERLLSKYDYIINKYSSFADFIGRGRDESSKVSSINGKISTNTSLIIGCASAISCFSIAAFVFVTNKKKKTN